MHRHELFQTFVFFLREMSHDKTLGPGYLHISNYFTWDYSFKLRVRFCIA